MRVLAMVLGSMLFLSSPCYAFLGVGQEGSKGKRLEKEKAISTEKSHETAQAKGKKEEQSKKKEMSTVVSKAAKKALETRDDRSFSVVVSPLALVTAEVIKKENAGEGMWGQCRLLTRRPRLQDYGPQWERDGVVYSTMLEYLKQMAQAQAYVKDAHDMDELLKCVSFYVKTVGSTLWYMNDYVKSIGKDWIGLQDLQKRTSVLLEEATRRPAVPVAKMAAMIQDGYSKCQYDGEITRWRCGALLIDWNPSFTVTIAGIPYWGSDTVAGFRAEYTLNAAWSLDRAWEEFTADSNTTSITQAWSSYIDELEKKGKTTRASLLKKKALQMAAQGKVDINLKPVP